jgi:ParB family chromosome partitioning protein
MKQRTVSRSTGPGMPLMRFSNEPHPSKPEANLESANETGRDIRLIDPKLIDPNPLAPREVYTAAMIAVRAEELKTQGQRDPVHVIPNPSHPDRFIIADGWTRVQACLKHNALDKLLAEVHLELNLESSAWLGWENNEGRSAHTDIDRGLFFSKMLERGQTAAEIATKAKISESAMTFFKAYAKLPSEVMSIMRESPERFGSLVAYNLLRLTERVGTSAAIELMGKYLKEGHGTRWIVAQVKALLAPPSPRAASSRHTSLKYQTGYLKTRPDGRVEVAIHVAPEKLDEFSKALEALLLTVAVLASPEDAESKSLNV